MSIQAANQNMSSLNPQQASQAIRACLDADIPLMLWGAPGIGKSAIVQQYVESVGGHLIDIRLSQYDAVDLRGVPVVNHADMLTQWMPPETLPFVGNAAFAGLSDKPIVLFFDEINGAAPSVLSAAYQLILDRKCGEHTLMPNVRVLAAGNREGDRGVTTRMPSPLANRFCHVEVVPHLDSWCEWALGAGISPITLSFLRNARPDLLNTFDPAKADKAFATQRTWEYADTFIRKDLPAAVEFALVSGCVGSGAAAEFTAYRNVWGKMPNLDLVLQDPLNAPLPEDLAVCYATAAGLAARTTKDNFAVVLDYVARMKPQFAVLCVKDAVKRSSQLLMTKEFVRFSTEHRQLFGA